MIPSPQISVQVSLRVRLPPSQVKPGSIKQVMEHPSPSSVLLSSHSSGLMRMPSPHTIDHVLGPVPERIVHSQPTSTLQSLSQPSPGSRAAPSSHLVGSVLYSTSSPHISEQVSTTDILPPLHSQ